MAICAFAFAILKNKSLSILCFHQKSAEKSADFTKKSADYFWLIK